MIAKLSVQWVRLEVRERTHKYSETHTHTHTPSTKQTHSYHAVKGCCQGVATVP